MIGGGFAGAGFDGMTGCRLDVEPTAASRGK